MHRPRFTLTLTLTLTLVFSDPLHLGLRSLTPNFLDSLGLYFEYKSTHSSLHALSLSLPQSSHNTRFSTMLLILLHL